MKTSARIFEQDLYNILSIQPAASTVDVRKAYLRAALVSHPDKGGSESSFRSVNFAFEVLSRPTTRHAYDRIRKCKSMPGDSCIKLCPANGSTSSAKGMKRKAPTMCARACPAKRRRAGSTTHVSTSPLNSALQGLKGVLQSMTTADRRSAILSFPQHVRTALLAFMEDPHVTPHVARTKYQGVTTSARPCYADEVSILPSHGMWTLKVGHEARYKARVNFDSLCLYTRWQADVKIAIQHQIVLLRIRYTIKARAAANASVYDDPTLLPCIVEAVLESSGVTESELGLSAYVTLRGYGCRVESPAVALPDALQLRKRLLKARETSWQHLRAEWIKMLGAGRRRMSPARAAALVDDKRSKALSSGLQRALRMVTRLLDPEKG